MAALALAETSEGLADRRGEWARIEGGLLLFGDAGEISWLPESWALGVRP